MKADYELILVTVILGASIMPGMAQTVGNGTVIAPSSIIIGTSAGQREFAGSSAAANNSFSSEAGVGDYATRHYTNRGETSGIGGSFIGTASVTSESSPAVIINSTPRNYVPQFRLPNLDTGFGSVMVSPALNSYTPALPQAPRASSLTNPFDPVEVNHDYTHTGLDELPSFNSQPSFMQRAQFDPFGKH